MPTYVYKCTSCANGYELRESFSAPAQHPCPECGELSRRVPVAAPVIFKGAGFYRTEGRKESANGASSSSDNSDSASKSDSPASSDKTDPSSSDSKPAEKAATTPAPTASPGHGHSHAPGGHTHQG